jgi:Flp pilus assembly protein TadG
MPPTRNPFRRPSLRQRNRLAALAARDDGSSLIEFSVTLPLLFSLIFCFMEMCLAFYSYNLISEAAREGTRYAMFRGTSCTTSGGSSCTVTATQVNNFVTALPWPNSAAGTISAVTTYAAAGSSTFTAGGSKTTGSSVKVQVTYVFPIHMPFVPNHGLTMVSTSQATIID